MVLNHENLQDPRATLERAWSEMLQKVHKLRESALVLQGVETMTEVMKRQGSLSSHTNQVVGNPSTIESLEASYLQARRWIGEACRFYGAALRQDVYIEGYRLHPCFREAPRSHSTIRDQSSEVSVWELSTHIRLKDEISMAVDTASVLNLGYNYNRGSVALSMA